MVITCENIENKELLKWQKQILLKVQKVNISDMSDKNKYKVFKVVISSTFEKAKKKF
jgi:hypothetical protein